MEIKVSAKGFSSLGEQLGAAPEQINKALKRSISRVTRWANTQLIRRVAGVVSIRPRIIKGRVHVSIRDDSGLIFVGLDAVSARRLSPRQSRAGVKAGPGFFPGAFIVGGGGKIAGQVMKRRGGSRYPIDKQSVSISESAFPVVDAITAEISAKLETEFLHQISWLMQPHS